MSADPEDVWNDLLFRWRREEEPEQPDPEPDDIADDEHDETLSEEAEYTNTNR